MMSRFNHILLCSFHIAFISHSGWKANEVSRDETTTLNSDYILQHWQFKSKGLWILELFKCRFSLNNYLSSIHFWKIGNGIDTVGWGTKAQWTHQNISLFMILHCPLFIKRCRSVKTLCTFMQHQCRPARALCKGSNGWLKFLVARIIFKLKICTNNYEITIIMILESRARTTRRFGQTDPNCSDKGLFG